MTSIPVARSISTLGHPVVLVPMAAFITTSEHGVPPQQFRIIGVILVLLGAIVMGYSWLQVRSGRWTHVDASVRSERKSLHLFLAGLFFASALLVRLSTTHVKMSIALALSGALIAFGMATAPWLKMSLHAAFAAFAAALLWPDKLAVSAGLCIALAVAWSRLALGRHVLADVVAGLLTGATAGVIYQLWILFSKAPG